MPDLQPDPAVVTDRVEQIRQRLAAATPGYLTRENADLIANAPDDLAYLLAALDEARDRLAASQIEDLDKQRATNEDLRRQVAAVRALCHGTPSVWTQQILAALDTPAQQEQT